MSDRRITISIEIKIKLDFLIIVCSRRRLVAYSSFDHDDDDDIRVVVASTTSANSTEHPQSDNLQRASGSEERESLAGRQIVAETDLPKPGPKREMPFPRGAQRGKQRAESGPGYQSQLRVEKRGGNVEIDGGRTVQDQIFLRHHLEFPPKRVHVQQFLLRHVARAAWNQEHRSWESFIGTEREDASTSAPEMGQTGKSKQLQRHCHGDVQSESHEWCQQFAGDSMRFL